MKQKTNVGEQSEGKSVEGGGIARRSGTRGLFPGGTGRYNALHCSAGVSIISFRAPVQVPVTSRVLFVPLLRFCL